LAVPWLNASIEYGFRVGSIIMGKNVGGIDRILRIVVGLALIALAVLGVVGVWGYIGVVPLVTALIGWCPAYTVLGFKTCKTQ
jgi:fatty acid desaturase